ncbi:MAG: 4-hydroxy-tetrahydrodipicolinate synthase [Desulfovibrionaceae bacterium]|nr:4-hydroxy-tetrahydrodipicolinate synthase [Desulfovibrionaceae bacterium]
MLFSGVYTAIVTPFRDGRIDEECFRALIDWQIEEGVSGLVPCGTTGESATLSHEEHKRVIEICVDQVRGRVKVMAGSGSNNTTEAINLTRFAKEVGADGALLITPYYNKPTQEGLYQHFAAIARAVDIPLVAYNVPGRTGCNMLPATVGRLAHEFANFVGIKEATANMSQCSDVISACPGDFCVLSGDDFTALPLLALGGSGVISVTSNIMPRAMADMVKAFMAGDLARARELHFRLMPVHHSMFVETNPIPVKTALTLMGRIGAEMRLPLCPLSPANQEKLEAALRKAGLL